VAAATGPIVQVAYLVQDLPAAMKHWQESFGLPLFMHIDQVDCEAVTYQGEPVDFPLSTAIAQSGDLQIELLLMRPEQKARFPSFFRTGENKLHHYQVRTTDLNGVLERNRWHDKTLLRARALAGMEFCFVDAGLPDGSLLEIVEGSPEMLAFLEGFKAVSESWSESPQVLTAEEVAEVMSQ
jgi:hypothetical protein